MRKTNVAIILSAGLGLRFKENFVSRLTQNKKNNNYLLKQLMKIAGKTLLEHTLEKFEKNKKINEIILVVNQESKNLQEKIVKKNNFKKVKKIVLGGTTRQESSKNGVLACDLKKTGNVLIHDANRPFVSSKIINKVLKALKTYKAVTVAVPLTETLLKVNSDDFVLKIPPRSDFRREQTPQGFHYGIIKKAHQLAFRDDFKNATDDCSLIKKYQLAKILIIQGEEENIKITYPLDLYLANKLFQEKRFKK
ncbi:2-C-methyl-D-erythritol 4-phosphate cytidylyltransferase [Candidatus Shapirobacteria bacterium]|nr:2-C-methyl-D-erythritol 4-phosphate cytidylyltransferase [Candidatus Shapirobacteria bacterium]